jgi:hypothetical protein
MYALSGSNPRYKAKGIPPLSSEIGRAETTKIFNQSIHIESNNRYLKYVTSPHENTHNPIRL